MTVKQIDDYIVKPFSPREPVARIGAVLRRSDPGGAEGKIEAGLITMDTVSRQVFLDEKPTYIGPVLLQKVSIQNPVMTV